MKTIWKYCLEIVDAQVITVPQYYEVLYAGLDPSGAPCIWIEVNTEEPEVPVQIFIVGTGNPMPEVACIYVGSLVRGYLVWHVYTGFPEYK